MSLALPRSRRKSMAGRSFISILCVVCCCLAGGCNLPSDQPGAGQTLYDRLQHLDPQVRLEAIVEASRSRDPKALPYLVDRLSDPETEVRFAAIEALKLQSGTAFGYVPYGASARQQGSIARWRQWLAERTGAPASPASLATQPATAPAGEGGKEGGG